MSLSDGLLISELMNAIDTGNYNRVSSTLNSHRHLIHAQDDHYGTPLHRAAIKGQASIASLLIANGANVRARKKKHASTPLHYAAQTPILHQLYFEGGFVRETGGFRRT